MYSANVKINESEALEGYAPASAAVKVRKLPLPGDPNQSIATNLPVLQSA